MNKKTKALLAGCWALYSGLLFAAPAYAGEDKGLYVSTGSVTRAPSGWVEFCADNPAECSVASTAARDVVLSTRSWKELTRINTFVNESVTPMTDLDHFGVIEKWTFPDDGYGDCEDYVLLKQRMLVEAGWPRAALLITVVRDQKGEGHAVLTVKTDRGEFILDNQNAEILLWTKTGYQFVKRQSQTNPNVWVALGDPRPSVPTAAAR